MEEGIYLKTKKVNDKAWKAFVISDIFEMTTGASISKNEFSSGNTPRVTASDNNNGIGLFTNTLNHKNFRTNGNFISYSFLGSAFYHEYDVSLDMKIHGLKIKGKTLNKYLGQFLVTCLRHTILTPSYGNQISSKDLLTKKILLPISELGDPDWDFMEDYTRNKFKKIKKTYKNLQKHQIIDRRELGEVEWTTLSLNDLFDVSIGNNIDGNKIDKYTGTIPYITRKESNNGIDGFLNKSFDKKYYSEIENFVITIGNETAKPFVQRYNFYTGTKVNILTPKEEKINNFYIMQFICEMIEKQRNRFSYSFSANSTRLKLQNIKLPTKGGQLDLIFMEQYMKRIENKVLEKVQDKF